MGLRKTLRYVTSAVSVVVSAIKHRRAVWESHKAIVDLLDSASSEQIDRAIEDAEQCVYCTESGFCATHQRRINEAYESLFPSNMIEDPFLSEANLRSPTRPGPDFNRESLFPCPSCGRACYPAWVNCPECNRALNTTVSDPDTDTDTGADR